MNKIRPYYKRVGFWLGVATILLLLTMSVTMNYRLVKRMETLNIQSEGQLQLKNIAGQVENALSKAESYAESYGMQFQILCDKETNTDEEIYKFVHQQNKLLYDKTNGSCSATYIAYRDKLYMENFTPTANFHLTEREWYVGARKNQGRIYLTNPYIDANTGNMCYSISMLLEDGSTIIGMDFTMNNIQSYIEEMNNTIEGISMIVNNTGMIVGHSNAELVGQNYEVLEYSELIDKVYNLYGDYFEYEIPSGLSYTVFSDCTTYGWYPIVCLPSTMLVSTMTTNSMLVNVFLVILCSGFLAMFIYFSYRRENMERQIEDKEFAIKSLYGEITRPVSVIMNQLEMAKTLNNSAATTSDLIRESAEELKTVLANVKSVVEMKKESAKERLNEHENTETADTGAHRKQGAAIVVVLVIAAVISISINTITQNTSVKARMTKEAEQYGSQLQSWVDTNITITNDMALHLGANPELYKDYDKAIRYLDNVVRDNSDISVAYIVNPAWEHTVLMNNGWEPTDPTWHVEQRDWYIDTVLSDDGFSISTPYKDEQTGMYCVTFSQIVYSETKEVIGIIGIDFYMDKLINILGESYTRDGYAFLTDPNYTILNHPSADYQMSVDTSVSAADTEYRGVLVSEQVTTLRDYDSSVKVGIATREKKSGFTVVTIKNFWNIYSTLIVTDVMLLAIFFVSIGVILVIIRYMTQWQERLNRKLQIAADEAIEAGKAKSNFLANMSHEIRTPINAVLGMNEMIQREAKDPVILEYAADIQSAGRTLLSIINDILDFSKIESGKMQILPVDYDLSSMINDLVNMIAARAEKKGLKLDIDIDEKLPVRLYGDDVRLRQIITNILTNAVKYTETGSVTLSIRSQDKVRDDAESQEGKRQKIRLLVAVKDTGKGIREEDMKKLFDSFTRIDEQSNRNIEGTGLGISITSRLLQMMGSHLEVDSVFGKGSTFYFTVLQEVVDSRPIGDYKQRYRSAQQQPTAELKKVVPKAKILLVDDTPMNLKVETKLLRRTKAIVDTASGGQEALDKLSAEHYDIVFLDHMMPGMDGIETLCEAKKRELVATTPVIVLTANAVAGAKQTYLDAGFDDYLSKPVKGEEIEKMVLKYVRQELIEEEEA